MLRPFQEDAKRRIYAEWQRPGVLNVMCVLPTGAGKTVLFCDIAKELNAPTVVISHRQELVAQAALALNRERVPHGIIAPKTVIRQVIALEHDTHGYSDYQYRAPVRVTGIDSFVGHDPADRWLSQVELAIVDEGHHVLKDNKWAKGLALVPNARGLFPTAHAVRADGRGLGRSADGLADALCVGPCGRDLINGGWLTDYRVLCPDSDIDFSDVPIGSTGDYSMPKLRAVTHRSNRLVGDVVRHYKTHADGCLGVTFAVDVEDAKKLAAAYHAAGVPAAVITAHTPIGVRGQLMKQFRRRQLLQLVSVDCLGEGTDVPAIEVVSMARRTASWQLFCQQFGRALRIMVSDELNAAWGSMTDTQRLAHIAASSKKRALIIDHVGNFMYHAESRGPPDSRQEYSLLRAESRARRTVGAIGYKVCPSCTQPYERVHVACPFCGWVPEPANRSTPKAVEGDLIELSAEVLARMRKEVERVDSAPRVPENVSADVAGVIRHRHYERQRAQSTLRAAMMLWGGWRAHCGESEREAQKRFFLLFGVDCVSALALGAADAAELEGKIRTHLSKHNIVEAVRAA